ncbi:hypothetical protein CHU98_g5619 [Xylaria longipes]|nr:hypothetical protein CHU98_g5619 [Xylaria longipes]
MLTIASCVDANLIDKAISGVSHGTKCDMRLMNLKTTRLGSSAPNLWTSRDPTMTAARFWDPPPFIHFYLARSSAALALHRRLDLVIALNNLHTLIMALPIDPDLPTKSKQGGGQLENPRLNRLTTADGRLPALGVNGALRRKLRRRHRYLKEKHCAVCQEQRHAAAWTHGQVRRVGIRSSSHLPGASSTCKLHVSMLRGGCRVATELDSQATIQTATPNENIASVLLLVTRDGGRKDLGTWGFCTATGATRARLSDLHDTVTPKAPNT